MLRDKEVIKAMLMAAGLLYVEVAFPEELRLETYGPTGHIFVVLRFDGRGKLTQVGVE